MKLIHIFFVCFMVAILGGCSENETTKPSIDNPLNFSLFDFGNSGSAKDILITFNNLPVESNVENYNLILVKRSSQTEVSLELANHLDQDRMFAMSKTGFPQRKQVDKQFFDVDGNPIGNELYHAYLFTRSHSPSLENNIAGPVELDLIHQPFYEVAESYINAKYSVGSISYSSKCNCLMISSLYRIFKIDLSTNEQEVVYDNIGRNHMGIFDLDGESYIGGVLDAGAVIAFRPDGTREILGTGFKVPLGMAFDSDGNLFVADENQWSISVILPNGEFGPFLYNESGLLEGPHSLTFYNGSLYSTLYWTNKILKIELDGSTSIFTEFLEVPANEKGNKNITSDGEYLYATSPRGVFEIDHEGNIKLIVPALQDVSDTRIPGPGPLAKLVKPKALEVKGDTIYVNDGRQIRMIIRHR